MGGADEQAAADYFAVRYGDAVTVRWRGPDRFREVPQPFGSRTSDGRRIRLFSHSIAAVGNPATPVA